MGSSDEIFLLKILVPLQRTRFNGQYRLSDERRPWT